MSVGLVTFLWDKSSICGSYHGVVLVNFKIKISIKNGETCDDNRVKRKKKTYKINGLVGEKRGNIVI